MIATATVSGRVPGSRPRVLIQAVAARSFFTLPKNRVIWTNKQKPMNATNFLAAYKSGRVLLHLACIFRRPTHAAWHWRGIMREINQPCLHSRGTLFLHLAVGLLPGLLLLAVAASARSARPTAASQARAPRSQRPVPASTIVLHTFPSIERWRRSPGSFVCDERVPQPALHFGAELVSRGVHVRVLRRFSRWS